MAEAKLLSDEELLRVARKALDAEADARLRQGFETRMHEGLAAAIAAISPTLEAKGRERGLEEAAKVAEDWYVGLAVREANPFPTIQGAIAAAIRALKSSPSALSGGWQSIETAPKDGTPFLVFDPILGVLGCYYEVPAEGDEWEEGFAFRGLMDGDYCYQCNATHWQPLPEPPKASP